MTTCSQMAESQAFPSALTQVSGKEYSNITLHDNVRAHLGDNYTYLPQGKPGRRDH
jgi:hypothetical protein